MLSRLRPEWEVAVANNLRQYEKDESQKLQRLVEDMNRLHAQMGGRDGRPERVALLKCMAILDKEIKRSRAEVPHG